MVPQAQLAVSFRWLLALYLVIPVCLLLQGLDVWFWQGFLKSHLPTSPSHFLLFQFLFGTPHIIASMLLMTTNREYLTHYQNRLLLMSLAIAVIFGIGSLFIPYQALYILAACWTVLHVLKQQFGIARGLCRLPALAYYLLLGLSVVTGVMIYLGIFLKNSLAPGQAETFRYVAASLCSVLTLASLYCLRLVPTRFGQWFLGSNTMLVLSSFYLYAQQYYFLAIMVPRLVHDATAYFFYITHDYNKHHQSPKNLLYRLAQRYKIHYFLVLPIVSFGLTFILQSYGDAIVNVVTRNLFDFEIRKAVTLGIIGYLGLMHYYTESFTWKNDSPYRKYIAFGPAI